MRILDKNKFIYFMLLIIIVCYANCFNSSVMFDPQFSFKRDTANMYCIHGMYDSSLFSNDPVVKNFRKSISILCPDLLYFGIYSIMMHVFSLPIAIKILPIILCIFATILIYRIGIYLYSQEQAFLLSGVFLIYFLSMDSFYGGQQRSFGALIFCIFVFFFIKENFIFLPFVIILAISFYPTLSVTLAATCILSILFFHNKLAQFKKHNMYIFLLFSTTIISFIIGLQSLWFKLALKNLAVIQDYKYSQGADVPINPHNPFHILWYFVLNMNEHTMQYVFFTKSFIILALFFTIFRNKKAFQLPKQIWIMLLASALSFLIIYPIHPTSASRQFVFTIPLFLVFFSTINISNIMKERLNAFFILLPLALLFIILHPIYNATLSTRKYKPIYDYIGNLPKDTMIAGYPSSLLVESLPLFSKRTIFFADKLRDLSLFVYEPQELKRMRKRLIEIIYTDSQDKLDSFISDYKIDYFVIESYLYENSFINLLNNSMRQYEHKVYSVIKSEQHQNDYLLLRLAQEYYDFKLYQDGNYIYILNSKRIKREYK